MTPVLQDHLPFAAWTDPRTRRLPGIQPLGDAPWLWRDEAFAGQMALRDGLLADARDKVHALLPEARDAAGELLDAVLAALGADPGYTLAPDAVRRPDGVTVPLDRADPLATAARLVQEDLCLLQPGGAGEHVLTAAALCFPASWTLAEKIGRPLLRIHRPVHDYDADMAARVQRLFDAIRPEVPLWRLNALFYGDPDLHHPRTEDAPRRPPEGPAPYVRAERQVLRRLPETGAVVFSIHTFVVRRENLTPAQVAALDENPIGTASR